MICDILRYLPTMVIMTMTEVRGFDPITSEDGEVNQWLLLAFLKKGREDLENCLLQPGYSDCLNALKKLHSIMLMDLDMADDIRAYSKWAIKELNIFRKEGRDLSNFVNEQCRVMRVRTLSGDKHCYLVRQPGSFYMEIYKKESKEQEHAFEQAIIMKTNGGILGYEPSYSLAHIEMKNTFDVLRTVIPATNEKLRLAYL